MKHKYMKLKATKKEKGKKEGHSQKLSSVQTPKCSSLSSQQVPCLSARLVVSIKVMLDGKDKSKISANP
jgi:hypothetical protein